MITKLKNVPEDNIIEPNSLVSVPIIQNIRYFYKHKYLKEMYANLLVNVMNKDTANDVSPAFVEILKQTLQTDAEELSLFTKRNSKFPYLNLGYKVNERKKEYYILEEFVTIILFNKYNYYYDNINFRL